MQHLKDRPWLPHGAEKAGAEPPIEHTYATLQRSGWPRWVPLNTDIPIRARMVVGATIPSQPRGKYRPLYNYLAAMRLTEVTLRLVDFPVHVGMSLPPTAFKHQAFWSNQRTISIRPWTTAWHAAGFRIDKIHLDGDASWVRFRRRA